MSVGKRLRQVIAHSNMKVKEFSDLTGIPYRTLQQYLSDDRSPATDALTKICVQTSIDIHWLLTGQGPMYRNQSLPNPEQTLRHRHSALLALFDALDEDQQREILTTAQEKERLNKIEEQLSGILKKLG